MQKSLLSIVIVAVGGRQAIQDCLRALAGQCGKDRTEVIVVGCAGDGIGPHLAKVLPGVRIMELAERAPVPYMRRLGWQKAQGDIVAFTEDHCLPQDDWVERVRQAHQSSAGAIGGSVRAYEAGSLLDWAVYFCEYSPYLDPDAGTTEQLSGNNVSYKRRDLASGDGLWDTEVWETILHQRLRQHGVSLVCVPDMTVYFRNRFRPYEFLRLRLYYGRCFAGNRVAGKPAGQRILWALGAPLLPVWLLWRMARHARRRRSYWRHWSLALPWIVLFTVAWSMGEGLGYLFGPGESCQKV